MAFNQYPYLNVNDLNLDWIIAHFKEFIEDISDLKEWRITHEEQYNELLTFMNELKDGILPPSMYAAIKLWFETNAFDLVGEMVKHVYFGLNDAGYFIVTIPRQWRELVFNTTGLDIDTPLQTEYGHLTISY